MGTGTRSWGRGDGSEGMTRDGQDGGEVEGMEPRERTWGHEGEGIPVH